MESIVVQTVGLTKVFRDFWYRRRVLAVDNLDIDIRANEVFGLLGPNGSGKSTTIKMLLGLLYPTRGRIRVLGRAPTDVAVKSRIGYLPEESYLYRFLDGRETLDYYGRLFRLPRQERRRRVDQLLEMVGLRREARRRVGEYSKGMARRIGLAQALINDPDLLILDEPTTGLDPLGTREIKDLIVFLNRQKKKTILLCSHLLADVEDVCQRVAILYGGKRAAAGNIRELLSQENLTQITTDRLDEKTLVRVRQLVEKEAGKQVISVSTPSDRLETLFLRIVKEAQEARQATYGVSTAGQIADFLATQRDEGTRLVESLVTAGQQAASVRTHEAAETDSGPAEPEPSHDVIEDLVTGAAAPSSRDAGAPAPVGEHHARTEEDADRDVIDALIQKSDTPGGRSKE
jgi:ABC-2 type transport system ATP-binding protein